MKNEYYKISKKGPWYTVKSKEIEYQKVTIYRRQHRQLSEACGRRMYVTKKTNEYKKLNFVIERNIKHLRQIGIVLITTEMDGTHSIYIPKINKWSGDATLILFMDKVTHYQYFNGVLLIIRKNKYSFFYLEDYAKQMLTAEDSHIILRKNICDMDGQIEAHDKIHFTGNMPYIKGNYCYENSYVISTASGIDYAVIPDGRYDMLVYTVKPLGKVEYLNSGFIKVTNTNGKQYIASKNVSYGDEELYDEINPFRDSDYLLIKGDFDENTEYYGYWFMNYSHKDTTYQMRIYEEGNDTAIYTLDFEKTVPKLTLITRIDFKNHNVDIWRVSSEPYSKGRLLIRCGNEQKYVELNKFQFGLTL